MTTHIDFEHARMNMIEQQIRTWEVLDQNVLDLMYEIHREDFVPDAYKQLALADLNIPLANGQIMMTPKLEARLLQDVAIKEGETVLEIGTGSAYLTALIAARAGQVESIDIYDDFIRDANSKLANYKLDNVSLRSCNVFENWTSDSDYDVIVVGGSVPILPPLFQDKLATGGRLFVIVGDSPIMQAQLITRQGDNEWSTEYLFETDLPALSGVEKVSSFEF